jgi:WD40 repeat protein
MTAPGPTVGPGSHGGWDRAVARIVGVGGRVAGLGVLVSRSEVVTCAHVVTEVLGVEMASVAPIGELEVVFPRVPAAQRVLARVSKRGWAAMTDDFLGDVAVLELVGPLPPGALPARLARGGDLRGHTYEVIGYRRGEPYPVEIRAQGEIVGFSAHDRLQLGPATASGDRFKLDRGCSGTPVFDLTLGHVVGLFQITDTRTDSNLSFALGTGRVFEAWPELLERYMRVCPYRPLAPFGPDDPYFFGRMRLAEDVIGMVRRSRGWCMVQGPSGTGKTSLMQARVMPALARDADALPVRLRPTDRSTAARALAAALSRWTATSSPVAGAAGDGGQGWPTEAVLAEEIDRNAFDEFRGVLDSAGRRYLVLIVDQAEDLLQLEDAGGARFVGALMAWSRLRNSHRDPLVRIVLVTANVSSGQLLRLPRVAEAVEKIEYVGPLSEGELVEAVRAPLAVDGLVEPAPQLPERIAQDLSANAYSLPVLQVLMARLWERDAARGQLTFGSYEEVRADRVFADYLDDVWPALGTAARAQAERLFLHLVTPLDRDGTQAVHYTSRVAARHELDQDAWALEPPLRAHRIVATNHIDGQDTIEFTHDSVAQAWPAVRTLVERHLPLLRWRQAVRPRIDAWQQVLGSGPDPAKPAGPRAGGVVVLPGPWRRGRDWLLKPAELADADRRLADHSALLSTRESAFLDASRRLRRRYRQIVAFTAITVIAAATATGGTVLRQRRTMREQQRAATVENVIKSAEAQRGGNIRQALALGLAAERIRPSAESAASLYATLAGTRLAATLPTPYTSADVNGVAFSPDGRLLATTLDGGTLWEITPGRPPVRAGSLHGGGGTYGVAFRPKGRVLATAKLDGTAVLTDVSDPRHPVSLAVLGGRGGSTIAVAFSRDGRLLATGGTDQTVRLWNVADPRHASLLAVGTGHRDDVVAVAFRPDGHLLASASTDGTAAFWDITRPGRLVRRSAVPSRTGLVYGSATFSPDGELFATADLSTATVWEITNGRPVLMATLPGHTSGVAGVAFGPHERTLAVAGWDGKAILWDLSRPRAPEATVTVTGPSLLHGVGFSPDGRWLAVGNSDGSTSLWDVTRSLPGGPPGRSLTGHDARPRVMDFDQRGDRIVTAADDKRALLWDTADLRRPVGAVTVPPNVAGIAAAAISPDGRYLATSAGDGPALWDVAAPRHPSRAAILPGPIRTVTMLVYSPNSTVVVGADFNFGILWDVTRPDRPVRLRMLRHGNNIESASFSEDGRVLATASVHQVKLWDLTNPNDPGSQIPGVDDIEAAALSRDAYLLAIGGRAGTAALWDVTNPQRPVRTAPLPPTASGAPGALLAAAFSPDGRTLATGGSDGVVAAWDVSDPRRPVPISRLSTGTGVIHQVAFSPDGDTLAAISEATAVALWDVHWMHGLPGHLDEAACAAAGGGLTQADWASAAPGIPYQRTC